MWRAGPTTSLRPAWRAPRSARGRDVRERGGDRYRRATSGSIVARLPSSTSSSSTATASTASGTRSDWTKPSKPSTAAPPTPRSSFAGPALPTCSRRRGGAAHAAEEHVLLSQAPVRASVPSGDDVTPWLEMCRLCVADIREVLDSLPTRVEREPVLQRGVGGDDTTAIDQAAEDAVVARLAALDGDFVLVSEELGERACSAPAGRRESSSTRSTAPSMRSAGSRSSRSRSRSPRARRWATSGSATSTTSDRARSGRRARARSVPRRREAGSATTEGDDRDPVLRGDDDADHLRPHRPCSTSQNVCASWARSSSLCHLAAGRVDGVVSLKPARSVDIAAAQLLVRECGLAIELFEDPPFVDAPLDLGARSRLAAAGSSALVERLAVALQVRSPR